jgi:S-DNA-T family DNA segregation ATPase FtsK/SpoIIIE
VAACACACGGGSGGIHVLGELRLAAKWAVDSAWYRVRFHAYRLPKYAALVAWYAPLGACRAVGRLLHWA